MKNLFKLHPTQSHLIPQNPTIISSLLYIYIIRYQLHTKTSDVTNSLFIISRSLLGKFKFLQTNHKQMYYTQIKIILIIINKFKLKIFI